MLPLPSFYIYIYIYIYIVYQKNIYIYIKFIPFDGSNPSKVVPYFLNFWINDKIVPKTKFTAQKTEVLFIFFYHKKTKQNYGSQLNGGFSCFPIPFYNLRITYS